MMTGLVHDQNLEKQIEKQMGCMAGFLQIFDRHQLLAGKRLYATKRLPPAPSVDLTGELEKQPEAVMEVRSPAPEVKVPVEVPAKMPLPLSMFEMKEGAKSWKFSKEAPRLSLDSRAIVDAKGKLYPREIRTNAAILSANRCDNSSDGGFDNDKHHRSPSVIARLMGLEKLPVADPESVKKSELRRSASESRVSRDLNQYRFTDGNNHHLKQQNQFNSGSNVSINMMRDNVAREDHHHLHQTLNVRSVDRNEYAVRNMKSEPARATNRGLGHRKSFFDSQDFFPEPKQTVSIYGEIEKRLKMRGIDEPSRDLETLKQILDALQLKGLLHSTKPLNRMNNRNIVYDRRFTGNESPIVVMKPARGTISINRTSRVGDDSPPSSFRSKTGARRNLNTADESLPTMSPRRDRTEIDRNARNRSRGRSPSSPSRSEIGVKSPNRRRTTNGESQKRVSDSLEQRRVSPVHSPKVSSGRIRIDHQTANRSPRNIRPTTEIYSREEKLFTPTEDESSTISESSFSTSSHTDTERSKMEDYKEGRSLLERCDKLLHSIAEITEAELQPSPVSVLDSFYKEEESPSPVMKRSIDFKDHPVELDDLWSPAILLQTDFKTGHISNDCDFIYISEILQALNFSRDDSDTFLFLENQQYLKGNDTSKASRLQRRLIFDTINEILDQKRQLPAWKMTGRHSLQQIWSEFQRIKERDSSEDLFETICSVLRKDLAADTIHGWGDSPIEMSEAVLDIERLIYKDLIGETIRDLAAFAGNCNPTLRRKLVF